MKMTLTTPAILIQQRNYEKKKSIGPFQTSLPYVFMLRNKHGHPGGRHSRVVKGDLKGTDLNTEGVIILKPLRCAINIYF